MRSDRHLIERTLTLAWMTASPLVALEACLGEDFDFGLEVFAVFARDAYFLQDDTSLLKDRSGIGRVPHRDICVLSNEHPLWHRTITLDHMSRLYLQVETVASEGYMEVSINSENPRADRYLNVQLYQQSDGNAWGKAHVCRTVGGIGVISRRFLVRLEDAWPHCPWILIVSNWGVDEGADDLDFALVVRLANSEAALHPLYGENAN
jgi:hypothetical protein